MAIGLFLTLPQGKRKKMSKVPPHGKLILGGNAFRVTGIYSSTVMQVLQCKTPLCSELGHSTGSKYYYKSNYYDIGLMSDVS